MTNTWKSMVVGFINSNISVCACVCVCYRIRSLKTNYLNKYLSSLSPADIFFYLCDAVCSFHLKAVLLYSSVPVSKVIPHDTLH